MQTAAWAHTCGAVFVCVGIAIYGLLTAWVAPLSARLHYDPGLQYMLASLGVFRGGTYAYVDHPGTPVEVLGTLLFGLTYPLIRIQEQPFVDYYLAHPQQFLSLGQSVVVLASVGVAWLLARHLVVGSSLVGVGLAGLFFPLLPDSFRALGEWSHESFCFAAGAGLALALLVALRRSPVPSRRAQLALAFATGVLTSIQLYFAAWVVGVAIALLLAARFKGAAWRDLGVQGAVILGGGGAGFIAATLPIIPRYRQLAGWVWLLISHQGIYGLGPQGVPTADELAGNLNGLVQAAPLVFVASAVAVALLAHGVLSRQLSQANVAAGLGLLAQTLVLMLLVAKHPGERYLLPIAATLPVLLGAALDRPSARARVLGATPGAILIAAFGASLWLAVAAHMATFDRLQRDDRLTTDILTRYARQRGVLPEALQTLWTYDTTSPCYALWFGNDAAERRFQADIARLCPHDLNLNIWDGQVTTPNGEVPLAVYADWDVTIVPVLETRNRPYIGLEGGTTVMSLGLLGERPLAFIPSTRVATAGP